jgi:hypothetical protein
MSAGLTNLGSAELACHVYDALKAHGSLTRAQIVAALPPGASDSDACAGLVFAQSHPLPDRSQRVTWTAAPAGVLYRLE